MFHRFAVLDPHNIGDPHHDFLPAGWDTHEFASMPAAYRNVSGHFVPFRDNLFYADPQIGHCGTHRREELPDSVSSGRLSWPGIVVHEVRRG